MASAYNPDDPYGVNPADPTIDPSTGLPWASGPSTTLGPAAGSTTLGPAPGSTTLQNPVVQSGQTVTGGTQGPNAGAVPPGFTIDWNTGVLTPVAPVASAAPPPSGGGGTTNTPAAPTFNWPTFTPPDYTPATPYQAAPAFTPTPFSYQSFQAPSLADAQNQPGYQFGLQQGQAALQNSAAAAGTLRSGGNLEALFNYTNAAAEQNYGNVFNQDLTGYNTNFNTAYQTWAGNNGANLSAAQFNAGQNQAANTSLNAGNQQNYTNAYQNAAGAFNPAFSAAQSTFSDQYNRWLAQLNSLTNIAVAGGS